MHSFETYGKLLVQTSIDRYTHVLNAVTLVWGLLRLAPIIISYMSFPIAYRTQTLGVPKSLEDGQNSWDPRPPYP